MPKKFSSKKKSSLSPEDFFRLDKELDALIAAGKKLGLETQDLIDRAKMKQALEDITHQPE